MLDIEKKAMKYLCVKVENGKLISLTYEYFSSSFLK